MVALFASTTEICKLNLRQTAAKFGPDFAGFTTRTGRVAQTRFHKICEPFLKSDNYRTRFYFWELIDLEHSRAMMRLIVEILRSIRRLGIDYSEPGL